MPVKQRPASPSGGGVQFEALGTSDSSHQTACSAADTAYLTPLDAPEEPFQLDALLAIYGLRR